MSALRKKLKEHVGLESLSEGPIIEDVKGAWKCCNKGGGMEQLLSQIAELGNLGRAIPVDDVRQLMRRTTALFREVLTAEGNSRGSIKAVTTKLRDAGRRSAPWKPTSSRVPGRPQDGADGNRRNRWLFPEDHKFYADEVTATLVEIRYYLQALSMTAAPRMPNDLLTKSLAWLTQHPIEPGAYRDPIQQIAVKLPELMADPRMFESGHLVPLDRGGRHDPENTFLMLKTSNDLQGNLTVDELLDFMRAILERHELAARRQSA